MKSIIALSILALSTIASAGTVVYQGRLPYPYASTSFGYNKEDGKAWIIISSGVDVPMDGGSYWEGDEKELPVAGLTVDMKTKEIKYNGVACGKIRNPVIQVSEYPFKNYGTCRFVNSAKTTRIEDFRGHHDVVENTLSLEVSE